MLLAHKACKASKVTQVLLDHKASKAYKACREIWAQQVLLVLLAALVTRVLLEQLVLSEQQVRLALPV